MHASAKRAAEAAAEGGIVLGLAYGFVSSGLFICAGVYFTIDLELD